MTPCQFADLAVTIARHAEELSAGNVPDDATLHRVWKRASRCFQTWCKELETAATPRLYAELFAAELPLRVWCAAVGGTGGRRSAPASIAGKVFRDLLELRCVVLQALAADHGMTSAEAAEVDRFRRRCERWSDVLVGSLAASSRVSDYAFQPERAAEFARGGERDPHGEATWPLVATGIRLAFAAADAFRGADAKRPASPAAGLAAAILASFPAAAFNRDGRLRPRRVRRVSRVMTETTPVRRRDAAHGPPAPKVEPSAEASKTAPEPAAPPAAINFASLRKRPSR